MAAAVQDRTILAVWLPYWPVERRRQEGDGDPRRPFVLTAPRQGGIRLTALNPAAEAEGLHRDQLVTDARAMVRDLQVGDADPDGDATALERLALWCTRFTPWTAVDRTQVLDGQDGLLLDISGCGHLFGGDGGLMRQLLARLAAFGLTARAAVAPTPGAAQALARAGYGQAPVVGADGLQAALASLDIATLRLDPAAVEGLNRLGIRRVGQFVDMPRRPLAARFGAATLRRLDQALGLEGEPISPDMPVVAYRARMSVAEPLVVAEHVKAVVGRLAGELCRRLEADERGALALEFVACRVDGAVLALRAGTSRPVNEAAHVARLFHEKIDRLEAAFDAGFGFETFSLAAVEIADRPPREDRFEAMGEGSDMELGHLVDLLGNRLGIARVRRLHPHQSHIPERAVIAVPAIRGGLPRELVRETHDWQEEVAALACEGPHRPLCLLPCPEPIEVIAEVPEGAPQRFRWRKVAYAVARAEGPERIGAEWWRREDAGRPQRTRDYFRLEDEGGRRFWVYRDGLYGRETDAPRWYMHGVFA